MSWDPVAPWLSGPELAYGSLDLATISVPSQSFRDSGGGGGSDVGAPSAFGSCCWRSSDRSVTSTMLTISVVVVM
jgi:hypothetical protein